MRRLLTLPLMFAPLLAAAQTVGTDQSAPAWQQSALKAAQPVQPGSLLVQSQSTTTANAQTQNASSLAANPLDGGTVSASTLQYGVTPNVTTQATINQKSWATQPRIVGTEVGATYANGRYSLGLSVAQDQVTDPSSLPRVLPGTVTGVSGLTDFDNSTQLNARGRLSLGGNSGVVVGASMGRIRLLPGNLLGTNTLDQKALSLGVDHGPISGSIVGRTLQPDVNNIGMPNSGLYPDRHWNSIDLGVTWHLPWQGALSFGAQNVWSSGNAANTPAGPPQPDQSRTPYVQYHQDL